MDAVSLIELNFVPASFLNVIYGNECMIVSARIRFPEIIMMNRVMHCCTV